MPRPNMSIPKDILVETTVHLSSAIHANISPTDIAKSIAFLFARLSAAGWTISPTSSTRPKPGSTQGRVNVTHGGSYSNEYLIWRHMRYRCNDPRRKGWINYGGRGIKVCPEWDTDFSAFYAHVGPRPSLKHSLDRIDNDGDYEPGNVRWATAKEQANNRRTNRSKIMVANPSN